MQLTRADGRRREVSWSDPAPAAAAAMRLDGLAFLHAIADGELPAPPVAALLGMRLVAVEPGRVTFAMDVGEHLYNPLGSVHGGVFSALLDSALACAVHSLLPSGVGYTTVDLTVHLVKRLTAHTPAVEAVGEVVSLGSRVATATGRITAPDGSPYAHATATCLLLLSPAPPGPGVTSAIPAIGSERLVAANAEDGHAR